MRRYLIIIGFFLPVILFIYSCQDAAQIEQQRYFSNGRDIYLLKCKNCHGANGEGLAALAPPLTDTTYLKANRNKLAQIIKHGMSGPITINGQQYDEKMPANPTLADIDIAQIIVYITNSFGNKQGMYTHQEASRDLKNQ